MSVAAKAKAQADAALEDAAVSLKRTINQCRRALQSVRQSQMQLKGVEVIEIDAVNQTPGQEAPGYVDDNSRS